jgi:predicted Zn-dependent peptidase
MSVVNIKSENDLSGFYVIYRGSCLNERPGIYGLSHLMEHLVCKSFDYMQNDLEQDGISWNAYTANNMIVFYFNGLDDKLEKYKKPILEGLLKFEVTEKEFENERKIVLEEYLDSFNGQPESHSLNLMRKLFKYYNPIGLREDLTEITLSDCHDFFKLQYSKPHQIVNVSKYSEFKTDIIFSKKEFDGFDFSYKTGFEKFPIEKLNDFDGKVSIINLSPVVSEDFAYVDFITRMLGAGLNSPLYQEVREKNGLVYYINCYQEPMSFNNSLINISTVTSEENVDLVQDIIHGILKNKDKFLEAKRFEIIKESLKVSKRKREINKHNIDYDMLMPKEWQVFNIIDTITLEEIHRVCDKYFNFDTYYKSRDDKEFV